MFKLGFCIFQLNSAGYRNIDALDLSPGMLEVARKKNVYTNFYEALLGDELAIPNGLCLFLSDCKTLSDG